MSYVIAFLGFAILIILHELGHFAAAKAVGMRVERFSLFFGPMIAKFRRGETEYGIGAIPLGGYVKITGMNPHEELPPEVAARSYFRQPVWKRLVVIGAGPAVNLVLAFLILWVLFWSQGMSESTNQVEAVQPHSPAAGVLAPGDRILAVDGVRVPPEGFGPRVARHHCSGPVVKGCKATTAARVTFSRGGSERTVSVTPYYDPRVQRTRLGFGFGVASVPLGPARSADESVDALWSFTTGTVSTVAQLFKPEKRKELSSVVGAYESVRQTVEFSFTRALFLLAVVSLSLGVINLFPFLPLDGGHIFWALAEKVRGRAIPFSIMERAGAVGFMLVILVFLIGLSNDIGRLTGDGFGVR